MAFKQRLTAPSKTDKYWLSTSNGGYNLCIKVAGGPSCLPNCVGYAYGRFMEIMGATSCKLSRGNAGTWYSYKSDGYERGTTPAVGAVICWSKPGAAGHVAIVEKINSDGSLLVSQSGYKNEQYNPSNSTHFWTGTCKYSNGSYSVSWNSSAYIFQGFIYNPSAGSSSTQSNDLLQQFLYIAESHIGEDGTWAWATSGLAKGQPWCAAYMVACAKTVGILDVIIPFTYGAGNMCRLSVANGMGTWHPGPHQGKSFTPQPGDLIFYRWKKFTGVDQYYAQHVGVVKDVRDGCAITLEGNTSSRVGSNKYSLTATFINGYVRPDWERVGASVSNLCYYVFNPLYSESSTSSDAMVREIGYIQKSTKYEPSISASDVKLSLINYTPALSAWYAVIAAVQAAQQGLVPGNSAYVESSSAYTGTAGSAYTGTASSSNSATAIVDNLGNNERVIVEYCVSKGLNVAAAIGILANIKAESGCRPNAYTIDTNGKPSGGICQWNASRYTAMVNYVGDNWKTNLTGQLNFMWYEISSQYVSYFKNLVKKIYGEDTTLIAALNAVPVNVSGAMKAADIWVRVFERPANMDSASKTRQSYAQTYWNSIAVQMI